MFVLIFDFLTVLYKLFIILATISFWSIASFYIYYCCNALFHRKKLKISEWISFFFSNAFICFSIITRIFFPEFHRSFFDILALLFIVICFNLSRYADKVNGRRWWNW